MKLNDYMWVSDLQLLSEHQYNSLMNYLRFLGIKPVLSFSRMKAFTQMESVKPESVVMSASKRGAEVLLYCVSASVALLETLHSYEDIIRMAEMGELMTHEKV